MAHAYHDLHIGRGKNPGALPFAVAICGYAAGVIDCEVGRMQSWDVNSLEMQHSSPVILSSNADARVIVLELAGGEAMDEHHVHERALVMVVRGEVEIGVAGGERVQGGPGLLVEFDREEPHDVVAQVDSRLLLLLTPWPAPGHPGAMSLDEKATVRQRAAEAAGTAGPPPDSA